MLDIFASYGQRGSLFSIHKRSVGVKRGIMLNLRMKYSYLEAELLLVWYTWGLSSTTGKDDLSVCEPLTNEPLWLGKAVLWGAVYSSVTEMRLEQMEWYTVLSAYCLF